MANLKSESLDSSFKSDYDKMQKLNFVSDYGMRNFHKFVSDTFNYLILPLLLSYRYKDGSESKEKDIEYFYDLSSSSIEFLKNEPSFFRFYDYLKSKKDKTETETLAYNILTSWDIPNFKFYTDLSTATGKNCELEKLDYDISSSYSPVLFDKQSRAWYESLWNAFYIACTGVTLNDNVDDYMWRVSSPIINSKDDFFSSLKNLTWKDLSSVNLQDDYMSKLYNPVWTSDNIHPITRYCESYDDVMYEDLIFISRSILPIRDWEKERMSDITYSFWKPISEYFGKTIKDIDVDSRLYFKDELTWSDAVGGINTYKVGMDKAKGWDDMDSTEISSYSWLSKPWRTVQVDGYEDRGQNQFQTYDWKFSNVKDEERNPHIIPPYKTVVENIYALAYIWTKFLQSENQDGDKKYISHATGQQRIPYHHNERNQQIDIAWNISIELSDDVDLQKLIDVDEVEIGTAHCQLDVISSDTGWFSPDAYINSFYYNRSGGEYSEGQPPRIEDYLSYDYGDLSGKCHYNLNEKIYYCDWDSTKPDEDKYAKQMMLLFPRSKEQQRRDELSALCAEYLPQMEDISSLTGELSILLDDLSTQLDDLSALSAMLENFLYQDAYRYAWENVYNHEDISQLSDFLIFTDLQPYLNFVLGDFYNVQNWDFVSELLLSVRDYISSLPVLSGCPIVNTLDDLKSVYYSYLLPYPQLQSYIDALGCICLSMTESAITQTTSGFLNSIPWTAAKVDVLYFQSMLNGANSVLGSGWTALFEGFILENFEFYLQDYFNQYYNILFEIYDLETLIEELNEKLEELKEEYEKKKQEIEEKEYTVKIPTLKEISDLIRIKRNPDAVILDGSGINSTIRSVKCKMDILDGILSSVENYDGCNYRYPLSFEDDENEAIEKNAYLMFVKYNLNSQNGTQTIIEEKTKPYVADEYKDYDTFRKEYIPSITQEFKDKIGYTSKDLWWGGEYTNRVLNSYKMMYDSQIKCTISPLTIDIITTEKEVEVNFNGLVWTAQVLVVNALYNWELGIGNKKIDTLISWENRPRFREILPSKIPTDKSIDLAVFYPRLIMCLTSWKCQD